MSQPDGEPTANIVVEANWIAGVNALLRGDSLAYHRQLSVLSADTAAMARIAVRSLRGIRMGRSGHRAAAAESLLILERQHGERRPKVWTALAADRLLAAQWLAEQKRFAAADSLLQFTDAWVLEDAYDVAHAIFALAQLQRSRNAEGMGNAEAAVQFASLFLYAFDKAPSSQRALIVEARSRVARRGRHDSADRQPSLRPPRGS